MRKTKNGKIIFDQAELAYIRENWQTKTAKEVAAHLGVTRTIVRMAAYEMGCKKMTLEYWTDEQIVFLKENYKTIGDTELAEMFTERWKKKKGWSKKHIEKKRRQLKWKRTKREIKAIHSRNVQNGRFQDCPRKMWRKIGITPPGEIRVWNQDAHPYNVIKTKNGFVHYNPWLWEKMHGPIPEGFIVAAKDGDNLNSHPENLELITRAEHARRNSLLRYPEPLRSPVKIKRKLIKLLNN